MEIKANAEEGGALMFRVVLWGAWSGLNPNFYSSILNGSRGGEQKVKRCKQGRREMVSAGI